MNNENLKKILNFNKCIVIILVICALFVCFYSIKNTTKNEIIQLSSQGKSQMMGYIIKTKNNELIVIDGGTIDDTQNLINKININGGRVKAWFLTHAHNDHVGAFTKIINDNINIDIEKIYVSFNEISWYEQNEPHRFEFTKELLNTLKNEKIKDKVEEVSLNQIIQIDNIKAQILGVKNPEIIDNPGNEQSMVIKFDTGKVTFLVLGDTGIKSSEKLLTYQKDKLKSDIVQMSHHGQSGATEELYKNINPKICMWPTPEWLWNNDIGTGTNSGTWKTFETREWIDKLNVKENCVSKDGDILIKVK